MVKPKRNQIYDAVIHRMVQESLAKKEMDFRMAHQEDTDEDLLEYLRQKAKELHHTPWPQEIVGWDLITERFAGWPNAVQKANLPIMITANSLPKFQLYQDEVEYQKKMYRFVRSQKKAQRIQRMKEKSEKQSDTQSPEEKPDND